MMSALARSELAVITSRPGNAAGRLYALMRQREALYPLFRETWDALDARFEAEALEGWAAAALDLLNVNAGPTCLCAFWTASREQPQALGLDALTGAAASAVEICREAGARAAAAALAAHHAARQRLESETALGRWWRAMAGLARLAPDCVEPLAPHTRRVLASGSVEAFEDFIAAGLKASGGSRAGRRAFFALEDELARRLVERAGAGPLLGDVERELKLFLTALWGRSPMLRALVGAAGQPAPRRANIAGPLIRLPESFPGLRGEAARLLFRAAAAHASAHLALGGPPFKVGALRPLQVALVNLIEDARIEALAMRRLPGLRALWTPYHVARPGGALTAPAIMARLARALFDPAYRDDDGVVAKGRALFVAAAPRLEDPAISREIGSLLGNDLGQMRVQFNAKAHVVEPAYRDDGLGLWDFEDDSSTAAEMLEMAVEAARLERREEADAPPRDDAPPDEQPAGRARPVAPDERGTVLATYPEWDRAAGAERPDWTTVRELAPAPGDPRAVEAALDAAGTLRRRIARLVRGARVGRAMRLKRQPDGHDLDLDAVLDASIALRAGDLPDPRVFRSSETRLRDVAVVLLIDVSESTRDRTAGGASVLDAERVAVAALAEAMTALGDPFSLLAFASNGRDDVRMVEVKPFAEPYGLPAAARLAGLAPGLSTRLGAALRHAGAVLESVASYRKLVIALTDGEPSDIDVPDPLDLVEDARRAVLGLRGRGIDSFGVVVGASSGSAPAIFGRANAMPVRRVEDLPARLAELYFRLARR